MRVIVSVSLAVLALWLAGLFAFVAQMPEEAPVVVPDDLRADGVVALTGGGGARIAAGMRLLAEGRAERLLVSGVHETTDKSDLAVFWSAPDRARYECCIDLGRAARSTRGNAAETADWAREHGYERLIIVTTDNHMPRSLLEIRAGLPEVELTPYPVRSDAAPRRDWMSRPEAWRILATEYTKFLVAWGRRRLDAQF